MLASLVLPKNYLNNLQILARCYLIELFLNSQDSQFFTVKKMHDSCRARELRTFVTATGRLQLESDEPERANSVFLPVRSVEIRLSLLRPAVNRHSRRLPAHCRGFAMINSRARSLDFIAVSTLALAANLQAMLLH